MSDPYETKTESVRQYDELSYRFNTTCSPGDAEEAIETVQAYGEALTEEAVKRVKALPTTADGRLILATRDQVIAAVTGKEE